MGRFGEGTRLERLNRAQWQGVETWLHPPYLANGSLEWHTGTGKTYACHKVYGRFRIKFPANEPENNIIVVVPSTKLKDDWENPLTGHIVKWGLENIEVFVINTYITETRRCKLLIIDEIHRVLGEEADSFNKAIDITTCNFRLGLSATLTDEEKNTLRAKGMPVCHTITEEEAREEGFTSDYLEYNLAVNLNHIEKAEYESYSKMFDKNKRYFVIDNRFDFKLMMQCTSNAHACLRVARYRGWSTSMGVDHADSPASIKKYANMCNKGMTMRKNILYNTKAKADVAEALIRKFSDMTIMTFSQTADMADELTARLPDISRSYHTKVKSEIRDPKDAQTDMFGTLRTKKPKKIGADKVKEESLMLFSSKAIRVLNAVKALDEGYDLPIINMSIILAASSKIRQQKQRKGRSTRFDEDDEEKKSVIINLYVPETQDEVWLKERQSTSKNIIWADNINDIGNEQHIEGEDFNIASSEPY